MGKRARKSPFSSQPQQAAARLLLLVPALARVLPSSWLCPSPQSRAPPPGARSDGQQRLQEGSTGLLLAVQCSLCLQTGSLAVILPRERNKAGGGRARSTRSEGALQGSWMGCCGQRGLWSLHPVLQEHH